MPTEAPFRKPQHPRLRFRKKNSMRDSSSYKLESRNVLVYSGSTRVESEMSAQSLCAFFPVRRKKPWFPDVISKSEKPDAVGGNGMKGFLWPALVGFIGLALTVLIGWASGAKMNVLTGDVFLVTRAPPFVGFLSNLGAFAWFAAVALLLFTIAIVSGKGTRALLSFLICSTLINLFLFIDDFFMIHDYWIRLWIWKVDLYFYIILSVIVAVYLYFFRKTILSNSFHHLIISFVFFIISIMIDIFQKAGTNYLGHWQYFVEDGFKWLGICFWISYFFTFCKDVIISENNADLKLKSS